MGDDDEAKRPADAAGPRAPDPDTIPNGQPKIGPGRDNPVDPFVEAVENTRMAMIFTDGESPHDTISFANEAFSKMTGYGRDEALGKDLRVLIMRGDDSVATAQVEAAFLRSDGDGPEIRFQRKDGSVFWATLFVSPIRPRHGSEFPNHMHRFASLIDVTATRTEHQRMRFLLDELNHRTQNTLATVRAIAEHTLRNAADQDVVAAFQGRLLALSRAHALLGRDNWGGVELREMLVQILTPFGLNGPGAPIAIEGPALRLPAKEALTLAVVFHELATNAVKYGALSNGARGEVRIAWEREEQAGTYRLNLLWREQGGPRVLPPQRQGFGHRLIEAGLAQELDGDVSMDFAPEGLACRLNMPLPDSAPVGEGPT